MTRLAQCPSCHAEYHLADEDIGHTFECQCGASLFACAAAGFDSIPLFCSGCGEEYAVDPEDIGESMECECGQVVTVPDVLFRMSLGAPDALPSTPSDPPQGSIACPNCNQQYDVTDEEVGETAECECGCLLKISKNESGRIFAKVAGENPIAVIVAEPEERDEKKTHRHSPVGEKKPVSWFAILGFGSVAVFFLTAVVMFLLREKPTYTEKAESVVEEIAPEPEPAPTVTLEDISPQGDVKQPPPESLLPQSGDSSGVPPSPTRRQNNDAVQTGAADQGGAADQANSLATDRSGGRSGKQPKRSLPDPDPPRPYIAVIEPKPTGFTFERAFRECFAAYELTSKLKNDSTLSGSDKDIAAYHQQLGKTIGLMKQTHEIGIRSGENEQIHELRYLLTYLHYQAGHLAEAAIMGEAVARWGKVDQPATREAAMVALAAMQEANATQWGLPDNVAELRQMETVAGVVAKRWPDEPQLGEIWMLLAQLYEVFGYPDDAGQMYAKVPEISEHFATAQIASGQSLWFRFLKQSAESPDNPKLARLLENARQRTARGTRELLSESTVPTEQLVTAKLSLARMAMRAGDAEDAVRWITEPPLPLEEAITPSSQRASEQKILVSAEFVRLTYETLFKARTQLKDLDGAQLALSRLGELLGPSATAKFGSLFLGAATDYIAELKASDLVTAQQIDKLQDLVTPLSEDEAALTYSNVLWIGESFSEVGDRAATPQLKVRCYEQAAAAYQRAMQRGDFPADSRQSAWLRQIELFRAAHKPGEAIAVLERLLSETPNAFRLQIEAAHALQEKALADGKPLELTAAIDGPAGKAGGSPIWGWGKLVSTLHGVRFSESAGEKSNDQFLEAQYNLVYCQWMMAKATSDKNERQAKRDDVARQLKKILATTSPESEPWISKIKQMDQEVSAAK